MFIFIQITVSLYLRNQTHDILSFSENMGETGSNWRSCLNSRVGNFSTVVAFHQTEKTFNLFIFLFLFYNRNLWNVVHLAVCDISLETTDVFVHDIHVLSVNEDEGFFGVETASDDILDIVITVFSVDLLFFHKIQILFSFCFTSMSASPLWKYFSSSVIWMTRGTLNASCKYLVKINGIKCPKCMASLEGPIF